MQQKPDFIQLARATVADYPDVEFYAVSCEQHKEICQKFNIMGYPTLFTFSNVEDKSGSKLTKPVGSYYTTQSLAESLQLSKVMATKGATELLRRTARRTQGKNDEDEDEDAGENKTDPQNDDNEAESNEENASKIDDKESLQKKDNKENGLEDDNKDSNPNDGAKDNDPNDEGNGKSRNDASREKHQEDEDKEKEQKDEDKKKEQKDDDNKKEQKDDDKEEEQKDDNKEKKEQKNYESKKDRKDEDTENDQKVDDGEKEQKDDGKKAQRTDDGKKKEQKDDGQEKNQKGDRKEKNQKKVGKEKDQKDVGAKNDKEEDGKVEEDNGKEKEIEGNEKKDHKDEDKRNEQLDKEEPEVDGSGDETENEPDVEDDDNGGKKRPDEDPDEESEEGDDKARRNNNPTGQDDDKVNDEDEDEDEDDNENENGPGRKNPSNEEKEDDNVDMESQDAKIPFAEKINLPPIQRTSGGFDNQGRSSGGRAGAVKARFENKDMDRWKQAVLERKKELEKRRPALGAVSKNRKGPKPNTRNDSKFGSKEEKAKPDALTKAMKVRTPGTEEYIANRAAIAKLLEKNKKIERSSKPLAGKTADIELKKDKLPFSKDVRKPSFVRKQVERVPILKRFVKMTPEEELILDATLSFVNGLRYGVFMSEQPLSQKKTMILRDWLDLLSVSLPLEWGIHRLIDTLRRNIYVISESDKNLGRVIDSYPLPRTIWSQSCTQSRVGRGFSCGFWKLLHVVTVGIAEQKGGLNLIGSGMVDSRTKTFSPLEAADTIKNYIENFFGCEECRNKFVAHYNECDNNRRCDRLADSADDATVADWKELALWLWEVHNEVSVRIHHEKIQRMSRTRRIESQGVQGKDEVRALWPDIAKCLVCFEDDGSWDEAEVFNMLERTYWYVENMHSVNLVLIYLASKRFLNATQA